MHRTFNWGDLNKIIFIPIQAVKNQHAQQRDITKQCGIAIHTCSSLQMEVIQHGLIVLLGCVPLDLVPSALRCIALAFQ